MLDVAWKCDRIDLALGNGQYTINNDNDYQSSTDTISSGEGISLSDLSLSKNANHLIITVGSDGDQLTPNN